MKRALSILLPCIAIAIAALFSVLDAGSALIISFALIAVVFFGTLPWLIMAALDQPRDGSRNAGSQVIAAFDAASALPEPESANKQNSP